MLGKSIGGAAFALALLIGAAPAAGAPAKPAPRCFGEKATIVVDKESEYRSPVPTATT